MDGLLKHYAQNPTSQGLFAAAAAMADRSGNPSFTQSMTGGLLAGSQGYNAALDRKRKMDAEDEMTARELQYRTDAASGMFSTQAVPAQEAVYGDDPTKMQYTELSPATAGVPAEFDVQAAQLARYQRGLFNPGLSASIMQGPKANKDPTKWREYLLAQTTQGGSFDGTFEDYVALAPNIYSAAIAPLRATQGQKLKSETTPGAPKKFTLTVDGVVYGFNSQQELNNAKLTAGIR